MGIELTNAQIRRLASLITTLVALQLLVLIVMVGGSYYLLRELSPSSRGGQTPPQTVIAWEDLVREFNATQGSKDADVVVVEFSDFQCPYCKQFSEATRRELISKYGAHLRMVFKHYPLEQIHAQAMTGAIAAQCARREGKFWEMHELLFEHSANLSLEAVIELGRAVGLGPRYAKCVRLEETKDEVLADMSDAHRLGVQGTPTFVVNGRVLVGNLPEQVFRDAFAEAGLLPALRDR